MKQTRNRVWAAFAAAAVLVLLVPTAASAATIEYSSTGNLRPQSSSVSGGVYNDVSGAQGYSEGTGAGWAVYHIQNIRSSGGALVGSTYGPGWTTVTIYHPQTSGVISSCWWSADAPINGSLGLVCRVKTNGTARPATAPSSDAVELVSGRGNMVAGAENAAFPEWVDASQLGDGIDATTLTILGSDERSTYWRATDNSGNICLVSVLGTEVAGSACVSQDVFATSGTALLLEGPDGLGSAAYLFPESADKGPGATNSRLVLESEENSAGKISARAVSGSEFVFPSLINAALRDR